MDEADLSLLQLPAYTLISQSTICSSHGGLAIYLHDTFNYTLLSIYKRSKIWEGLFIEIEGKQLSENVVIGNMYRPPRDRNEHYQSFINEIDPVLTTLGNFKCKIILTGDLDINLLNVKPIFNEILDIITSHSFHPHITLPTILSRRYGTHIDNFFASLLLAYLMYHPAFSQVEYLIISLIVLALMSHVQLLTLINISM